MTTVPFRKAFAALGLALLLAACGGPSASGPSQLMPAASGAASGAAAEAGTHVLFVSNELNDTVAVLDAATGKPLRVLSGGDLDAPVGTSVAYGGKQFPFPILYVANSGNNTISEFNVTTGKPIGNGQALGGALHNPRGMAYLAPFLYIANGGNSTITVVNPTCGKGGCFSVAGEISDGGLTQPKGLKIADGKIYTANENDTVSVFDAVTWKPVSVISDPGFAGTSGIAISGKKLFVGNSGADDLTVLSTETQKPLATLSGGGLAEPFGMDGGGGIIYIADFDTNKVSRFDAATGAAMSELFAGTLDGPVEIYYY